MSPEFVSVVDMQGNLLSRPRKAGFDASDSADTLLEYKHQVEKDLMAKVEATLDPLLGEGRFRVGISADCDLSTSEQTDETFDPTRSVMASSQKSEDLAGSAGAGGVPGTPSNLPRSTIKPLVASPGSTVSRRTENTTFENLRTVRQVKMPRGSIKRLSAALLLDQDVEWQGKGVARKRVPIPPAPERIKAIRDIVAGVLGYARARRSASHREPAIRTDPRLGRYRRRPREAFAGGHAFGRKTAAGPARMDGGRRRAARDGCSGIRAARPEGENECGGCCRALLPGAAVKETGRVKV